MQNMKITDSIRFFYNDTSDAIQMLFFSLKKDLSRPGQDKLEGVLAQGSFNDTAGSGVETDFVLVQVPAKGGIVSVDEPEALALGQQFQAGRH